MTNETFALFGIDGGETAWLAAGTYEQCKERCDDAEAERTRYAMVDGRRCRVVAEDGDGDPTYEFLFIVPVAHFVSNI